MANFPTLLLLALLPLFLVLAFADDVDNRHNGIQDFCVTLPNSQASVNSLECKDTKLAEANDFFFSGLNIAGNTSNQLGSSVTPVFATQLPGLNTQAVSLARIDLAPWGINPPHMHPRASEILTVLEGQIEVGFITSNPDHRLIKKVLQEGDVFVFPLGLIHYQKNVGNGNAVAISGLGSENPGVITIANSVFGSNPSIPSDVLAKAIHLDTNVVNNVKSKF